MSEENENSTAKGVFDKMELTKIDIEAFRKKQEVDQVLVQEACVDSTLSVLNYVKSHVDKITNVKESKKELNDFFNNITKQAQLQIDLNNPTFLDLLPILLDFYKTLSKEETDQSGQLLKIVEKAIMPREEKVVNPKGGAIPLPNIPQYPGNDNPGGNIDKYKSGVKLLHYIDNLPKDNLTPEDLKILEELKKKLGSE